MATSFNLSITALQADASSANLCDKTLYGTGTNPVRTNRGNFLFAFYRGDLDFVATDAVPDTDNYQSNLDWVIDTPIDGWYRFILFSIPAYDNTVTYNPGELAFYQTNFYRNIATSTGTVPTEVANWVLVDITDFDALIALAVINHEVFYYDDILTPRIEDGIKQLALEDPKSICNACDSDNQKHVNRLNFWLNSAMANNWASRMDKAKTIIDAATEYLKTC